MNKSEYRARVQESKGLVLQGAEGRLRLGEIAQEVVAKQDNGGDRRSESFSGPGGPLISLEQFAADIDIEVETLRKYRDVTLRFGGKDKAPKASWSVLRELAFSKYGDDPMAAFKAIKAQYGKVTIITVRDYLGTKSAGVRSTSSTKDKVAQARTLIREVVAGDKEAAEEIAETLYSHPVSRNALTKVAVRLDREERDAADAAQRERAPGLTDMSDIITIQNTMHKEREHLRALVVALSKLNSLSPQTMDDMRETWGYVMEQVAWIEAFLKGGGSLTDELTDFLSRN